MTNTDAVVLQGKNVLSYSKQPTTSDVTLGVVRAVHSALKQAKTHGSLRIQQVNIGTTHFVNAVVRHSSELCRVAVIRLAKHPFTQSAPPFADFPKSLKEIVYGGLEYVSGGYEFDGKELGPIDSQELVHSVKGFVSEGVRNFVICGTFSSVKPDQENEAAAILQKTFGDSISITISHQIGRLGILERENAAILNESLKKLCHKAISGLTDALRIQIALSCPIYLAQNDGTICSVKQALQYPIFTFASGPTNSMRGAAFISGVKNGVVVDIGGTSTDVGVLVDGFPRPASSSVKIANVPTNFRMPHTLSIGLGGGSIVYYDEHQALHIGPKSVGYRLTQEAVCFGGSTLTATDIAVSNGLVPDIDRDAFSLQSKISNDLQTEGIALIHEKVETAIDRMKTTAEDIDVVLVGGGSILIDPHRPLKGCRRTITVEHSAVANAIGAALCQVSAHVDLVTSIEPGNQEARKKEIAKITQQVTNLAISNGAVASTVELVEFEEVKLSYIPGNAIRYNAKAVGDLENRTDFADCPELDLPPLTISSDVNSMDNNSQWTESGSEDIENFAPSAVSCENNQPWTLNFSDAECVAVGAGILACGGGGDPHIGKVRLLELMKQGKFPTVVSLKWLLSQNQPKGCISTGFIGAPVAQYERPSSGFEEARAFLVLARLLGDKSYSDSLKREKTVDDTVEFTDYADLPSDSLDSKHLKEVCSAVVPYEIGGINSALPLSVSAQLNLPCLDVDCMGRAFPELQMFTTAMYGWPIDPMVQVSDSGRVTICHSAKNAKIVEDFNRQVCVENGCSAGCAFFPVPAEKVADYCIQGSISRAWRLGKAVLEAKMKKISPFDVILSSEGGFVVGSGKISEVQRKVEGGFTRGNVIIDSSNNRFHIEFQNENTVVWKLNGQSSEAIVSVPDLICILNEEDGTPIATEELRYGLRVVVLALPADPLLKTETALKTVGPHAFGYPDVVFRPIR